VRLKVQCAHVHRVCSVHISVCRQAHSVTMHTERYSMVVCVATTAAAVQSCAVECGAGENIKLQESAVVSSST
jgi:hypothetical protein